ncbi:sulfotransferase [Tropicimonas aquimaris]|uniref:Sulfotransferase n=1 Tax=Tropicimonas aquimaris TaxID=914152 RepID=A0ABW3IP71_9RHOB
MPNIQNIKAPVSLIAHGRSGTSLLFKAFAARGDMDCVGEAGNMVFTTWRALEQVSGLTRYGKVENPDIYGRDAGALVRKAFLTIYPSEREHWMMKPIGTPRIMWDFSSKDWDAFAKWYWMVFNTSFPQARKFTIIRHPNDVFLSSKKFWGGKDLALWRAQYIMYKIIGHQHAGLRHIMLYDQLVADPEPQMRRMMERVGVPFSDRMMKAFGQLHVPTEGVHVQSDPGGALQEKAAKGFSREEEWGSIEDSEFREEAMAEYASLRSRAMDSAGA